MDFMVNSIIYLSQNHLYTTTCAMKPSMKPDTYVARKVQKALQATQMLHEHQKHSAHIKL